jgi:uncharacterized protein YjbK
MIESEFKCLLTFEQYNMIHRTIKEKFQVKKFIQINYFYDTDKYELDMNDITFRIRQKEDHLQMQLKGPAKKEGMLIIRSELSKDIIDFPTAIRLEESEWCDLLPCKGNITPKGSLVTERIKCNLNDSIEIDLDKNYYFGIVDYELEIEYKEGFMEEALSFLRNLIDDRERIPSIGGKRNRFFYKLKKTLNNERVTTDGVN